MIRLALIGVLAALVTFGYAGVANAALLAPKGVCPHDQDTSGHANRRAAVRCLINYARTHSGHRKVGYGRRIHHGAVYKSHLIRRYGFSHTAGGPVNRTFRLYERGARHYSVGEVLASGYFSPRGVVKAWLASRTHRAVLLGHFRAVGLSVHGSLWVGHVGRRW